MQASGNRFALRQLFLLLSIGAIISAVLAQVPGRSLLSALQSAPILIVGTLLLAGIPIGIVNLACVLIQWAINGNASQRPLRAWAPHRLLLQAVGAEPPTWMMTVSIAVASMVVTAALWGLLRELGSSVAVGLSQGWTRGMNVFDAKIMTDGAFQTRMFRWEVFSLTRWWLLFSLLTVVGLAIALVRRRTSTLEPAAIVRRLLAFGPWMVLLETAMLVGVWTTDPQVVPEPSTGFVEGIFGWDKWHWDCWRASVWINRGLIATIVVGYVFCWKVLRWRWPAALAAAVCIMPAALMMSVAWTVLYQHPDPLVRASGYFWRLLS